MESLENEIPNIQPLGRVRFTVQVTRPCIYLFIAYILRHETLVFIQDTDLVGSEQNIKQINSR